jgi:hypothetical protein
VQGIIITVIVTNGCMQVTYCLYQLVLRTMKFILILTTVSKQMNDIMRVTGAHEEEARGQRLVTLHDLT